MENDIKRFSRVYLNLPEAERKLVIAIIDDKKITWDRAYTEIHSKTKFSKEIINSLIKREII